ncbi:MAG: hypothetical protein IKY60_04975, partial [Bacteroidales bacterium]|nr:hypothetical protein [Bacteroidales bacterium]
NLRFNPESLTQGEQKNVTFTFDMSKAPTNDVFVTLTNLEPANNETLELVDVNTGKYKFKKRPTGTSASVDLRNTKTQAGTVGTVMLSSLYFDDATANIFMGCIIPAGHIQVGNVTQEITLYVSYSDLWNNDPLDISFIPKEINNNRQNEVDIVISAENYQRIMDDGNDTIYLRYSTGSGWGTTYYLASVSLSKLLDGTAGTLTFTEQSGW